MYEKMKQQRATEKKRATGMYDSRSMKNAQEQAEKRDAGWRRATEQNLKNLQRVPTMAKRYDIQLDDEKNPMKGAWYRARPAGQPDHDFSHDADLHEKTRGIK